MYHVSDILKNIEYVLTNMMILCIGFAEKFAYLSQHTPPFLGEQLLIWEYAI